MPNSDTQETTTPDLSAGNGPVIYPEPCPVPTEIIVPGCQDSIKVQLADTPLLSLGRIVQVDVTIQAVCPGKRVSASIILMEIAADGTKQPRGTKHILIPAQAGDACQDITLRCVAFSLPENLDAAGDTGTICAERKFEAMVIANYVDTDFSCCDETTVTV